MWNFTLTFESERRQRLSRFTSFEKVLDVVLSKARIQHAWVGNQKELGHPNCWRPEVALHVGLEAFDAFFNSPGGYRAQYLRDPDDGQAANNRVLRALEPMLTDATVQHCGEEKLTRSQMRLAFLANSAKIWPDEEELDWEGQSIDLAIVHWQQPCEWINAPKHAGLWAPEGETLKVFGAFLDQYGNEVVSPKKVLRRFDIHRCGFS